MTPAGQSKEIAMKTARPTSGRLRHRIASALLVLGLAVGALASTATPAQAATSVIGCFQRPSLDPALWTVRVDLRVWNHVQNVWQQTGRYAFIQISNAGPTCVTLAVPAAYQNYYTTAIVDYTYTQSGTTLAWYGWSGQYAAPGALGYRQNTAITKFTNRSSVDGLNVHSDYWH
jgi:hypothetical protein